jgi:Kef-type K+ transport system membrane component KefB
MDIHIPPLFIVLIAAVVAPLLGESTARWGVPVVVFELLLGVLIGPHGFGWVAPTGAIPYLALFGMALLFFLAGFEIDLFDIHQELRLALFAWLLSFGIAALAALTIRAVGLAHSWPVLAIAIATTAFGVVLPVLRDGGLLETPLGRHIVAAGAIGEIGPILAMALMISTRNTVQLQLLLTMIFALAVIALAWTMVRARTPKVLAMLRRTMTQSNQLPVRIVMLLMVGLAVLAENFGLELALGALAAGMAIGQATRNTNAHTHMLHSKLDAIGFGFLIPIFFINSGMKLEVTALFGGSGGIALALAFLFSLLVARVPLVLLHRRTLGALPAQAVGLFSATTLSLIVALTQIGIAHGLMTPAEAAPLVAGGMLTVVVFPMLGMRLAKRSH